MIYGIIDSIHPEKSAFTKIEEKLKIPINYQKNLRRELKVRLNGIKNI